MYGLWVTDGGGGVFKNIWSPNSAGQIGFYVSDTDTTGRIYEMSIEHHRDVEVRLKNVANWTFYALQTEENVGSEKATAIELDNSRNITFANAYFYRVRPSTFRIPMPYGSGTAIRFFSAGYTLSAWPYSRSTTRCINPIASGIGRTGKPPGCEFRSEGAEPAARG